MSTSTATLTQSGVGPESPQRLKQNAIGLPGVVFMVVAFSAPTTAMLGNVPVGVGYGVGLGMAASYLVATVILTIFSLAFIALARHITAAGAFYTFVTHGISKPFGLGAGALSFLAYATMEAALIGIFSALSQEAFASTFGLNISWIFFAAFAVVAIAILGYRHIEFASKILAVVLIAEIGILLVMALGVLFAGGGPDGLMFESINPISAFRTNGVVNGNISLGLLFAFWSWVGFEATAIYGEESENPKRTVPQATMIAVIGIGLFYAFISWMAVAGMGEAKAISLAKENPFQVIKAPMEKYGGDWALVVLDWIVLAGAFVCALAIHNSATRYLFAFGRDRLVWHKFGKVHPHFESPYIASVGQSIIASVILLFCFANGVAPYASLFVLVAIMATLALLVAEALTAAAAIGYFHVYGKHPETASWWQTLLAPIIGGSGILFACYLLLANLSTAAGGASDTLFFDLVPWIVVGVFFVTVLYALFLRHSYRAAYERIGSTVF